MAITNFQASIWSAELLTNLHADLTVVPTCNQDYEGEVQGGKEVKITGFTQPTIGTYSGTITTQALTDSTQTLAINQKKYFSFSVDDVDRIQSAGSFEPVTRDAAQAMAEDADDYVITQMTTNGTSVATSAVTTPALAYTAIQKIRTALNKAKVPQTDRFLLVNPEAEEHLLGEASKLLPVDTSGSSDAIRNGVIGRVLGFTVLTTPSTSLANSSRPAFVGYWGRAVAYANQLDKVRAKEMEAAFADQIAGLHVYGSKVLRATSVQTHIAAT